MSMKCLGNHDKKGRLIQPDSSQDGLTKQCYKNECDISKIMARADAAGTISHLAKFEMQYADFSDFDFHEQTRKLTQGREIFDELPAEIRQEFGQSPAKFFAYVNDPKNLGDLRDRLPGLAKPGRQLAPPELPSADLAVNTAAQPSPEPIPAEPPPAATPAPTPAET